MSNSAPITPNTLAGAAREPDRRGFIVQLLGDTFTRRAAQIGGLWIAVLVLAAAFAPFLANSFPYFVQLDDGSWAMPLFRHLSAVDVTLPVLLISAIVLFFVKRWTPGRRLLIWTGIGLGCFILAAMVATPPQLVNFQQYRLLEAEGRITSVLWAPIPYSPGDRIRDKRGLSHPVAPNETFPMGTERNGASVMSNMLHASRIALAVGFIATGIAIVIGIIVGGIMGYFSGTVDLIGMRIVEIFSAIPVFFLLLSFVAFFPGDPVFTLPPLGWLPDDWALKGWLEPVAITFTVPRIYMIMAIIGITGWVGYARFIRAEFLKLRQQEFVEAARACGLPLRSILFRHMLPNGVTPVLVEASFGVASAILYEATLSFLGIGLVDQPSWGTLLSQAVAAGGGFYWWLAIYPGMAIFLTVFAYNLIGESARDAIDPHTRKTA